MKKTAIAIAVALAGFATVAQAAPKDNTGMQVVSWAGPSITIPVSTVTVSKVTMVQFVTISWVLVRSVVTRLTRTSVSKWVTTGWAAWLIKAA